MKKPVSSCHFLIQKLAVSFLFLQLVSITPGKETKRNWLMFGCNSSQFFLAGFFIYLSSTMTSNWAVPWHPNKRLLIEYASKAKANNCSCWGGFNTTTYYSTEEQETLNFLYHRKVRKDLRMCCLDICWGSWVSSLPSWSEVCGWCFQSWLQGKGLERCFWSHPGAMQYHHQANSLQEQVQ